MILVAITEFLFSRLEKNALKEFKRFKICFKNKKMCFHIKLLHYK